MVVFVDVFSKSFANLLLDISHKTFKKKCVDLALGIKYESIP